eukprot:Colp12_sorted_trinity150504_noHs@8704
MSTADPVKAEEGEDTPEALLLRALTDNPKGLTNELLDQKLPQLDVKTRVAALNNLLKQNKLEILRAGKNLVYKAKLQPEVSVGGLQADEKLVYQIIQQAGNKGIWTKDLRTQASLQQTQMNKILKTMESKKLIKPIKSAVGSQKKVYMLYNLEPDRSLTGGAWYSEQEFEAEFVNVLSAYCFKFIQQRSVAAEAEESPIMRMVKSLCTASELQEYIAKLGVSKVDLEEEDIESILHTLVYDGKVEVYLDLPNFTISGDVILPPELRMREPGTKFFRSSRLPSTTNYLTRMPCGLCPVFRLCKEGAKISPQTCVYYHDWLEF